MIQQNYDKCKTQQEIADEVGVSRENVSDIITKFGKNGKIAEITNFTPFLYNIWNTKDSLWLPSYCWNCQRHFYAKSTGGNCCCPECDI